MLTTSCLLCCVLQLYASDDLGVTWTLVNKFVNSRFYWAIKGVDNDTRVIHMEVQDARLGEALSSNMSTFGSSVITVIASPGRPCLGTAMASPPWNQCPFTNSNVCLCFWIIDLRSKYYKSIKVFNCTLHA